MMKAKHPTTPRRSPHNPQSCLPTATVVAHPRLAGPVSHNRTW